LLNAPPFENVEYKTLDTDVGIAARGNGPQTPSANASPEALNAISTAAGGEATPEELAGIETEAGGTPETSCGNAFLDDQDCTNE